MRILIVGGAGYIGSHTVRECRRAGHDPVVFDNLSHGNAAAVEGVEVIEGDLHDARAVRSAFENYRFDAVFHFAAFTSVPESVAKPALYYHNNVAGSLNLISAVIEAGIERFVFSSTAATYGDPLEVPIPESHPTQPVNPYGRSKLLVESMLSEISKKHPLRYIALRYFNAAGADLAGDIGEDHGDRESHLIPLLLLNALGRRPEFKIFGTDYDTPDGTCIRDFVHVTDLARAHLLALDKMDQHPNQAFNLGASEGFSVRQVVDEVARVAGREYPLTVVETDRRPGDPAVLVASNHRARELLGWTPQFSDLRTIVESAWAWHRSHPSGYGSRPSRQATDEKSERFGAIATRLGFVDQDDVQRALQRQTQESENGHRDKLIGLHMLEMGLLSTSQLIEILREYEEE